jgi:Rrf2 family iron-sulfur cluster assembly transcriptional regulator
MSRPVAFLSRRARLALEAVLDIALNGAEGRVSSRALAERLAIPQRHLEPSLQALVRAGILKGQRGPQGGYTLARERRRISLADILAAVEPSEAPPVNASPLAREVVEPMLARLEEGLLRECDTLTLDRLCDEAEQRRLASRTTGPVDFTI